MVVLMVSSSAMAARTVIEDNFKGTDGTDPKGGIWDRHEDGAEDEVYLEENALVLEGSGAVKTREDIAFHTKEWEVRVDVSARSLEGEPFEIGMESETKKDKETIIVASLALSYSQEHGWTVTWLLNETEEVEESGINNTVVGEWYTVRMGVEKKTFHVNVTLMSDESLVWEYEGDCDVFDKENFVELGTVHSEAAYDKFRVFDTAYYWQDNPETDITIVMFIIFFIVLFLPFLVRKVEHNLEAFLFSMGFLAVTMNTLLMDKSLIEVSAEGGHHDLPPFWTFALVIAALRDPLMITVAVLVAGLAFHYYRDLFKRYMGAAIEKLGFKIFVMVIVISLGMVASLITAIIAALLLVEVITVLQLDRKTETELTILTCFSIGLGAALTPVGEPLSTIVIVTKLQEEFWYLAKTIGKYIIPSVVAFGIIAYFYAGRSHVTRDTLSEDKVEEELKEVPIRAFRVYLFVMALVLLGTGFAPLIEWYIIKLHPMVLYWVNTSSAILDNATLAAAEITKGMTIEQINAALMALLFSGGMLIPGNIPNIIAAGKLHITSKEWAKFGAPMGAIWLAIFFVILFILKI
jgi:predicted cation transporter